MKYSYHAFGKLTNTTIWTYAILAIGSGLILSNRFIYIPFEKKKNLVNKKRCNRE